MSSPKYLVFVGSPGLGGEFAIIFPPWKTHREMADCFYHFDDFKSCILGAGEFSIGDPMEEDSRGFMRPGVSCFGESISLGIKSRGKVDAEILKASLFGD